jgi:hypothetical protein
MALFSCNFYRAEYLSEFNAVHIVFVGEVKTNQIVKLRCIISCLSESLKIEKLILDFTECSQAFIDYNSHARIAFWKDLEKHDLKMILLIIPQSQSTKAGITSWESFYKKNKMSIEVSAISDRKLMPLFFINNELSEQ